MSLPRMNDPTGIRLFESPRYRATGPGGYRSWHFLLMAIAMTGCTSHSGTNLGYEQLNQIKMFNPIIEGENDKLASEFRIENTTHDKLIITDIQKTCSCTSAYLDTDMIAPNTSTLLHVTASLSGRYGPQSFNCTLTDNKQHQWRLSTNLVIYKAIEFADQILLFGPISNGQPVRRESELRLHVRRDAPMVGPLEIIPDSPALTVARRSERVQEVVDTILEKAVRLEVTLTPSAESQKGISGITARIPGHAEVRQLVTWRLEPVYKTFPSRLFIRPSQSEKVVFSIQRLDGQPFRVRKISCSLKGVECASSHQQRQAKHYITLGVGGNFKELEFGEVIVEAEGQTSDKIIIPISVFDFN